MVFFHSLFRVVSENILKIIKAIAPYQLSGYKVLELVVNSKLISSSYRYDLCPISILRSSNPVLTEEITYFRAKEHTVRRTEERTHSQARE
jgi:hypothetical protein